VASGCETVAGIAGYGESIDASLRGGDRTRPAARRVPEIHPSIEGSIKTMKFQKKMWLPLVTTATMAGSNAVAAGIGAGNGAVQRALAQLNTHGQAVNKSDGDLFDARDVIVDADGSEHVRFDRSYKGLRVIGGDVVAHSNGKGAFVSASHTLGKSIDLDTNAYLGEDQAVELAELTFSSMRDGKSKAELVIYARGEQPVLAYEVRVSGMRNAGVRSDGTPSEMHYVVDANFANILDAWDGIQTAAVVGTGKTLFDGNVSITADSQGTGGYALRDPSRGNGYTTNLANKTGGTGTLFTDADNIWGNNTTSDAATVTADAHFGVASTWDYYKNVHGRLGIANDGKGAYSRVHYGRRYVNAFWSDSCFCMTYGDGDGVSYYPLVSLDVAGHEMSHGVTSRTANLTYSGESGGLNEANSDIFGTMVEYYVNSTSDKPDYLIGEKLYMSNASGTKALRYMFKPSLDGASPDCYKGTIGSLDVHYSSGVGNHFFYLLAEGATVPSGFSLTASQLVCNGDTNAGKIGRDAAQKIWYRALTVYMTSNTSYAGARTATLKAAADLYGSTSTQYAGVASAWSAVGVN